MASEVTVLEIEHIVRSPGVIGGDPRIAGRRIGVHEIVNLHLRLGVTVDEIAEDFDLTPAQIHAALAYYYDHKDEIDQINAENERLAAEHVDTEREAQLRALVEERAARWEQEMTVSEIAQEYGISPQAVRKACEQGWVAARKSGATWLIKRWDAHERWADKGEHPP